MENNVRIEGEINAGFTSYWNKEIGKRYHSMTKTDKIIEAADRFDDPLGYDEAGKVSEKAEVPRSEVLRIWRDNDVNLRGLHPNIKLEWDDLIDHQREALAYYYHNKDNIKDKFSSEKRLFEIIGAILDKEHYSIRDTVSSHKWLLKDDYKPDWLDEDENEYLITDETMDEISEALDTEPEQEQTSLTEDVTEQETDVEDEDVDEEEIEEAEEIVEEMEKETEQSAPEQQTMDKDNIVTAQMGSDMAWSIITTLIKNGNEEDAKEMFYSIIDK